MMVLAFSAVKVVSTREGSSSSDPDQPSSNASVCKRSNRPASLDRDERPRASRVSLRLDPISLSLRFSDIRRRSKKSIRSRVLARPLPLF
jgi:hypothetical protein